MVGRRVLLSFAGGRGHLEPMLPLAKGLIDAGHAVAIAGDAAVLEHVDGGTESFPFPTALSRSPTTGMLVRPDLEEEFRTVGRHFVERLGPRNARLVGEVIASWRPDLVVHDEVDFGGAWAAELAGLPHARTVVIASGLLLRSDVLRAPVQRARTELGLPSDPELAALDGHVTLSSVPPSFRAPGARPLENLIAFRAGPGTSGPRPPRGSGEPVRVFCTLGTIFPSESGDLFHRLLRGLEHIGAEATVTVGHDLDRRQLGPVSERIRIERFVPQAPAMSSSDVVVNHGGSGSTITALAHGVPVLVTPMGADQELNAERVIALGVGARLDPMTSTPEDVAASIRSVVSSKSVSAAVHRLAAEAAAMPPIEEAIGRLEALLP